jgi:hypothetical protein
MRSGSETESQLKSSNGRLMTTFHQRFKIEIDITEARRRFVNRVHNVILENFMSSSSFTGDDRFRVERAVRTHLGDRARYSDSRPFPDMIGENFERNLNALEGLYTAMGAFGFDIARRRLGILIRELVERSEIDLEIEWRDGQFLATGAKELDQKLVNDNLDWLRRPGFETVIVPFEKALGHLLKARKDPALLAEVITNAYEALEARAKIVVASGKDLSAIQELFIKKVNASEEYKRVLKDYVEYADRFRHAASEKKQKPKLSYREAESFVYMTGIFLRLAMQDDSPS